MATDEIAQEKQARYEAALKVLNTNLAIIRVTKSNV